MERFDTVRATFRPVRMDDLKPHALAWVGVRMRWLGVNTEKSMYCTETETLKARKPHRCMSCGELVAVGEAYKRWRCYDGGDVGTVKMHPECHAMNCEDARGMGGGPWEFTPFSNERPKRDCGEAGHDEGRCGNASCLVA